MGPGGRDQVVEVGVGAEFAEDGLVAAIVFLDPVGVGRIGGGRSVANRPGAAGVAGVRDG